MSRTVPQIFDLWSDPQERYDIFMNNYTEHTWTLVTFNADVKTLMQSYIKYPPRKAQSETYTGPITISGYQRFQWVRAAGRVRSAVADGELNASGGLQASIKVSTRAARFERSSAFGRRAQDARDGHLSIFARTHQGARYILTASARGR